MAERQRTAAVAPKGHFAVYTKEGRRFVVPIAYLKSSIFVELFRWSEEEFGLPAADRPITLPCDGDFMEQVIAELGHASTRRRRKLMN
ncbi:auxin-responsive protein SAUR36-like [Zingiber officinale]|uniref:auxin-responsive protein SAUR36-like n=1 Tax=Zingiber officinale TaxID=94328 RepID=UPI001C4B522E|nr:auxin-responsive protein SAUR36-like [Zingiber officinale]XP_042425154.1 auxin-responsive protein SAUR36-like [Zingiber officinale]